MSRSYTVFVRREVEKELDSLETAQAGRLAKAILALETVPRPAGCVKLHGQNAYRIRCGVYRILYTISDDAREVDVFAVGHRREIYRGL